MKKKLSLLFISLFIISSLLFSQDKPEWNASKLVDFIDLIDYKPKNRFEGIPLDKLKSTILILSPETIKQMNINAWNYDKYKYDDCFRLWNLSYPDNKATKEKYEKYTYGFIMLLIIDGFLETRK